MEIDERNDLMKEIGVVIIASLFLGFVLALNVTWTKIIITGMEYLKMSLFSLLMIAIFVLSQKFVAFSLDCKIKIKLLSFRRYWFQGFTRDARPEFPFDFPLWFILPLFLLYLTNGFLRWLAILDFDIEPKPTKIRRRWKELDEDDVGKIALVGPISVLILGLIFRIAGFNQFGIICAVFAFLSLFPIGQGFKLLNSSRLVWMFAIVFSFFMILLMNLTNLFATIIIALLLAAIMTIAYYIFYE